MSIHKFPVPEQIKPRRVAVLYAGGTISSTVAPGGYRIGGTELPLLELLEEKAPLILPISVTQTRFVYTGLSENIHVSHLLGIEKAVSDCIDSGENDAIVITHGTDSMEHTAMYLHEKFGKELEDRGMCVILTGANHDTSHPETDAWENLQYAFSSTFDTEPGVYVAFHGRLIHSAHVVKEIFNGYTMNYCDMRDLAYLRAIDEKTQNDTELALEVGYLMEDQGYPFTSGSVANYAVNCRRSSHRRFLHRLPHTVKSVFLTLYHSGTANTEDPKSSVVDLVNELRRRGIVVYGYTENAEPVDLHSYETSVRLREAGLVPLYDMSTMVAVEKAGLSAHLSPRERIQIMFTAFADEVHFGEEHVSDIYALLDLYSQYPSDVDSVC